MIGFQAFRALIDERMFKFPELTLIIMSLFCKEEQEVCVEQKKREKNSGKGADHQVKDCQGTKQR